MRLNSLASLAFSVSLLLLIHGQAHAQECSQIDKNHPLQYITYDHVEDTVSPKKGKTHRLVWLRLHNNSNCRIKMRAEEYPPTFQAIKQPNGGIKVVGLDHIREGAPVQLVYRTQDKRRKKEPMLATPAHYTFGFSLLAGGTLTFSVQPDYFKKQHHVIVPFSYEGEASLESNAVSFFGGDSLLKIVRK